MFAIVFFTSSTIETTKGRINRLFVTFRSIFIVFIHCFYSLGRINQSQKLTTATRHQNRKELEKEVWPPARKGFFFFFFQKRTTLCEPPDLASHFHQSDTLLLSQAALWSPGCRHLHFLPVPADIWTQPLLRPRSCRWWRRRLAEEVRPGSLPTN